MQTTANRRMTCVALVAIVALLIAWSVYEVRSRAAVSQPLTVQDLYRLESEARGKPSDPDAAVRTAVAYAAFVHHLGSVRDAVEGTHSFVDTIKPHLSRQGAMSLQRQLEQVDAKWAEILRMYGINSEQERIRVLARGLDFTHRTLQRGDLDTPQRAVLHLAMGRILYQANRLSEAMEHAVLAERHCAESIPVHLLKADIFQEQQRWSEAIQELRAASIRLTAWAMQAPSWELRLVWTLLKPNRANAMERRWRERREKVAGDLRHVIASEILLLQNIRQIEHKLNPTHGSP
ncbi:MAG: hypothetical protein NZ749_08485 [bacterium]|nr:hypothetical protein [bacterium]